MLDTTIFDRIKKLSEKRGKTLPAVSADLNFSDNLFYRWKTSNPKGQDLAKVADYFNVSVDYLLGREEMKEVQKPVDLAELINDDDIDWDKWVSFDGKPICDEDKLILKRIFGNQLKD